MAEEEAAFDDTLDGEVEFACSLAPDTDDLVPDIDDLAADIEDLAFNLSPFETEDLMVDFPSLNDDLPAWLLLTLLLKERSFFLAVIFPLFFLLFGGGLLFGDVLLFGAPLDLGGCAGPLPVFGSSTFSFSFSSAKGEKRK